MTTKMMKLMAGAAVVAAVANVEAESLRFEQNGDLHCVAPEMSVALRISAFAAGK